MERTVKCPHCGHEYGDEDMHRADNDLWEAAPNEEYVDEVCPSCKERFWIMGGYIPQYETFRTEEEYESA